MKQIVSSTYKIGDKVKIVNYGHLIWEHKDEPKERKLNFPLIMEDGNLMFLDMSPELIGKEGIIMQTTETQGKMKYAIEGPNKYGWYNGDQLELIIPIT